MSRLLFNVLSGKSPRLTQMRDEIFGPVRSQLDTAKQLPGSQAMKTSIKPIPENRDAIEVGRDYLGNIYWEMPPDPEKGRTKFKRWYFPQTDEDWDRPVPPEWESWLRYRRPDPPTEDEINRNIAIAQLKKLRAKEIEEKRRAEAGITAGEEAKEILEQGEDPLVLKRSHIGSSIEDQEPASEVMTGMYPIRKDLEATPGSSKDARLIDPMYDKRD